MVVALTDRPMKSATEKRLVSRFEWGLTTDIQVPNLKPGSPSCTRNKQSTHSRF